MLFFFDLIFGSKASLCLHEQLQLIHLYGPYYFFIRLYHGLFVYIFIPRSGLSALIREFEPCFCEHS